MGQKVKAAPFIVEKIHKEAERKMGLAKLITIPPEKLERVELLTDGGVGARCARLSGRAANYPHSDWRDGIQHL